MTPSPTLQSPRDRMIRLALLLVCSCSCSTAEYTDLITDDLAVELIQELERSTRDVKRDSKGNQIVSIEHLHGVISNLMAPIPERNDSFITAGQTKSLVGIIAKADLDNDGFIDFEEYKQLTETRPERRLSSTSLRSHKMKTQKHHTTKKDDDTTKKDDDTTKKDDGTTKKDDDDDGDDDGVDDDDDTTKKDDDDFYKDDKIDNKIYINNDGASLVDGDNNKKFFLGMPTWHDVVHYYHNNVQQWYWPDKNRQNGPKVRQH
jgi:hypothetical protein